jgi:hypothetical protein
VAGLYLWLVGRKRPAGPWRSTEKDSLSLSKKREAQIGGLDGQDELENIIWCKKNRMTWLHES